MCLGSDAPGLAVGAFILFVSNVVALVLTAMIVLTLAGYHRKPKTTGRHQWRAYAIVASALVAVAVPMTINSMTSLWSAQIADAASGWMGQVPGAQVADVTLHGSTATVFVLGPAELPPLGDLQESVDALVPWHPRVVLVHVVGDRTTSAP